MSAKGGRSYYFTDSVSVEYSPVGEGGAMDVDEPQAITLDGVYSDFFGTREFYRFGATVARPIEQTYHLEDGETVTLKKPTEELEKSLWQIENCPWTVGHPSPSKTVTSVDQIRGVWKDPYFADGQCSTLYVPKNDIEALSFIEDSKSVSIGFRASVELVDDESDVDGVQRGIIFDHIASVENGRCPTEKGCGIHTDSASATAREIESGYIHDGEFSVNSFGDSGCDCDGNSNLEGGLDILTVDSIREKNPAVDSRISELENEVDELTDELAERRKELRKSVQIDSAETPDDAEIRSENGKFDLRRHTK